MAPAETMGAEAGPDGRMRCWWCLGAPEHIDYHDHVWGRPMHGERELFEMLTLESFQSGLSTHFSISRCWTAIGGAGRM